MAFTFSGLNFVGDVSAQAVFPIPPVYYLQGWGYNAYGAVGDGSTIDRSSPVQIGALTTWSQIATGGQYSMATKIDGTLWTWGYNQFGQLGNGEPVGTYPSGRVSSPVQVGALTTWLSIAAGYSHSLAIKTDGTLWSWGGNYGTGMGQLGLGDTAFRSSPVQIGALTTWSKIAGGSLHTIAVKTDGTMWAWGSGGSGRLGLGNTTDYSSPKQIGALTTWSKIAAASSTSAAIKTDGTLWSWGYNYYGNVGDGTTIYRSSPVQIGALTTWSSIDGGDGYTLAIKTDGTLWSWGYNTTYGNLGDGTTISKSSPVQVGALTNWSMVSAGNLTSAAIKTDGTLWTWGANGSGSLGLGNTTHRSSPVQVGSSTTWYSVAAGANMLSITN
jgi:alpha-tubulin suppressor-like RCC1 family protein